MNIIKILKKNGEEQSFNGEKIKRAIRKSAERVCVELTDKDEKKVVDSVKKNLQFNQTAVPVSTVHNMVETALEDINPRIAKSYREYRDNKNAFSSMLDKVYSKKLSLNFVGDRSNANSDSALVTTQKAIVYNELNSELYKKFFLTQREERAMSEGYIYVHDRGSRLDTMNCFSKETRFITSDGVKSFSDFESGDSVLVPTHTGEWKNATVNKYGTQELFEVVLKRGSKGLKSVFCTSNHRWLLKDGSETTNLKVGDKIALTPDISDFDWDELSAEDKIWWVYGFCMADGATYQNSENSWYSQIRLCGHKREYSQYFIDAGFTVTTPNCFHGDCAVYVPSFRKDLFKREEVPFEKIRYFMNGWMCADGNRNLTYSSNSKFRGIQITGSSNDFIYDFLNIAGYFVTRKTDLTDVPTNFGNRISTTISYGTFSNQGCRGWVVQDIKSTGRHEEVWCLEVEDNHSFILENGIVTGNCCLFDMKNLITGGFVMGNLDYQEPKTLDVAFDLIGDVSLNAASFQYGGFTIPEIDKLLAPYAEKSYKMYYDEYMKIAGEEDMAFSQESQFLETQAYKNKRADAYATQKVRREFEQGFQSWEMKFNSVASSRGDYPFTAITFGTGTGKFELMCSSVALSVRKGGQGKKGKTHPVLFPKISFFYDEELHGEGKPYEWLFDEALECSMKTMYPDFISLTGDGYAPSIYKKYKKTISRMGCVTGDSTITYREVNGCIHGEEHDATFAQFWNRMKEKFIVKNQSDLGYSDKGFFIDLENIQIMDKERVFVNCERIIKNIGDKKWLAVYLDNDLELTCTYDHPWTLVDRDSVKAENLKVGDKVYDSNGNVREIAFIRNVEDIMDSYDVTTESSHFVVNGIYTHNCRANLSPWYIRGGMEPADENDEPIYTGRFNMGAISLNFPMIALKAKKEDKDFFEVFDYYLDMVRGIHLRTFEYLSHKKAGINPLGFCQGGFYNGNKNPEEELGEEFLRPMTMSFGVIGLNEASVVAIGKPIHKDNSWAKKVLEYINEYVNKYKKIDKILFAIYGTPGESLVGTIASLTKKRFGIIKDVSDRDYCTNSFHCPVYADITPIEKQDAEYPLFHLCNGGNIAYARMRSNYNFDAFKAITKRAMKLGLYWGNNQQLDFCEECGHSFIDSDVCPKCGSEHITRIERMNGYIGLASIRGRTMYSDHKLKEFKERVSM